METIANNISNALSGHRLKWCEFIATALSAYNDSRMSVDTSQSKDLYATYLDLMIRWYPQLDQNGEDSYSKFYASRVSKKAIQDGNPRVVPIANKVNLIVCANLKYSLNAMIALIAEHPEISYEHNPPVKYVREKLIELSDKLKNEGKKITVNCVDALLKDLKYSVVILSQTESDSLNGSKSFKETGSYEVRRARVYNIVNLKQWKVAEKNEKITELESQLINSLRSNPNCEWKPHVLRDAILTNTNKIKIEINEINYAQKQLMREKEISGLIDKYYRNLDSNAKSIICRYNMQSEVKNYIGSIIFNEINSK